MVSGLPWLFGSLHPLIQDFLVSTVHIRPELPLQFEGPEDVQSGPLEDSRPGSSPPPSRRKRRSRRRRASTAAQASPVGESDCASHTHPKRSEPGLHDLSTTVSNSVLPTIMLPESDNSATVCLDSKDVILSDTSVPRYSPAVLTSDLCVPEPSDSCNARSDLPELANMDVSTVELSEPKTVILHQTHLHTVTSIVALQNCFTQPVHSEVSQSELSHTPPPPSALDVTVHAVEHKPSKTVCSIADAPSSDCFMFQPVLSLGISDISQPTSQPATALSAPQRVTVNEACVAEQANLTCTPSILPEPGDTETISHSSAMNSLIFNPALVSVTPSVAPSVSQAVVFSVPQLESANSEATCVTSPSPVPAKHETVSVFPRGLLETVHSIPAKVKSRKVSSAIHKLAKEFGLSTAELVTQVNFSVPRSCQFNSVRHAFQPSLMDSVCTTSRATSCTTVCSVASHPGYPDTTCVNSPVPVTAPELTLPKTANYKLDSLRTAELLKPACHKSLNASTVFGTINLVYPVTVTVPVLCSPPPVPVPRAAQAQLSLAPVSVPRVRVAEVQLVPASVFSLAEAPFIPAPVPAPRVGLMDTQPLPAPVPAPRVRSAVTLLTPAPVSVPRVGAAEIQLAPAPTPAPRVKAARAQLVPAPVSVPRVGMAGVRPGPAPVPVPWRRAAKSQTPAQSPVQLPADPPSLQPPLQLALLSIAQSLSQLLAQFPALSPVQSLVQLLAQSPALLTAQQPIQSLPTSTGSLCELSQPAKDCVVLTHLGQTVCPAQPQPLHPKPTACPVQLQLASAEPEVSAPTGSASLLAGGSGEPLQPSLVSAGGSGEPLQPLFIFAGGSGEPGQHFHFVISAGGSGEPGQHFVVPAGGSEGPFQPSPAAASSPTPGPASASASTSPVAATPPSGPASASASTSPVAATPPSGPTPTKPRPVRQTLESRRRLPRGRPPDPLCSRRRLPRGRPPDPLCRCCHFSRGRPPEQPSCELCAVVPPG
ncbi:NLR family CARD domain-containing protein 3 [Sarotherodon galilaeus]